MRNTLETRLGVFVALALLAAVLVFEMIGGLDFFKTGPKVRARFDRILELKIGDPVKMAGVPIGRVSGIDLAENKVEVTMRLDRPEMVKTDSTASIKFVGLLGQNYVEIQFGSPNAPAVTEDAVLTTTEQADLSSLMTKLEDVATGVEGLARSFGGDDFKNMLGPFTDFIRENSPKLNTILSNIESVSTEIAKGEGTVGKLIRDEGLYTSALAAMTNLNSSAEDLRTMLNRVQTIVDNVRNGQGTLGKLTTDDLLYQETSAAMTNLREILEKINQGDGSIGKLVNDETLYKNLKLTLQKVEKATEGLEDQGPLSVLGVAVNSLF